MQRWAKCLSIPKSGLVWFQPAGNPRSHWGHLPVLSIPKSGLVWFQPAIVCFAIVYTQLSIPKSGLVWFQPQPGVDRMARPSQLSIPKSGLVWFQLPRPKIEDSLNYHFQSLRAD